MKKDSNDLIDIDGNIYKTVKIGNQIWMAENLNVDHFRNGDPITELKKDDDWDKAGDEERPACCYYKNDPKNGKKYGRLYNWYAVNDPRGLAPEGWHVPTDEEWKELEMYLGMSQSSANDIDYRGLDEGDKLKATSGWKENGNGTNESGFFALPGGERKFDGYFDTLGAIATFWSSTEENTSPIFAWPRSLNYLYSGVDRNISNKPSGYSIRLVRD